MRRCPVKIIYLLSIGSSNNRFQVSTNRERLLRSVLTEWRVGGGVGGWEARGVESFLIFELPKHIAIQR